MKHHFKIVKEFKLEYVPPNFLNSVGPRGVFFKCEKCRREIILNEVGLANLHSKEGLRLTMETCEGDPVLGMSFRSWLRSVRY